MKNVILMDHKDQQFKLMVEQTANRALSLCGRTADGQPLGPAVSQYLTEMSNGIGNSEALAELVKVTRLANSGDREAKQQLCGIRKLSFSNFLMGSQNVLPFFFDIVDLAEDEKPYAQNTTKSEVRVSYVGTDGSPMQTRLQRPHEELAIPLRFLSTDEVQYQTVDIYNGRAVSDSVLKTIDLAYDMRNKMDDVAWTLLQATVANGGAYGAITFTGSRANWPYVISGRSRVANLPTTNDIDVPGNGANTKFRYDVFKQVKKYGQQWGNMFPGGPLTPTGRILVPSSEASDIADQIVPSGATRNKVADQLLETGWATVDIHGTLYTLIADETLAPGACYAEYNRKPGTFLTKSALDEEFLNDTKQYKEKNLEGRWMRKPVGCYINSATRIFTARFKYRLGFTP